MSDLPVSRYPVPELADLPDDIRAKILALKKSLLYCVVNPNCCNNSVL